MKPTTFIKILFLTTNAAFTTKKNIPSSSTIKCFSNIFVFIFCKSEKVVDQKG